MFPRSNPHVLHMFLVSNPHVQLAPIGDYVCIKSHHIMNKSCHIIYHIDHYFITCPLQEFPIISLTNHKSHHIIPYHHLHQISPSTIPHHINHIIYHIIMECWCSHRFNEHFQSKSTNSSQNNYWIDKTFSYHISSYPTIFSSHVHLTSQTLH